MLNENRTIPPPVGEYKVEYWLSDADINSMPYSDYWNNEEIEKLKHWHVLEFGFAGLERHLAETGLVRQLEQGLDTAARLGHSVHGVGADLACGVLWSTSVLLNRIGTISKIYGVEYSKHRLLQIGPIVLGHYGIPADKVILCLGSFYELRLPDESLDFVILAEAFHHADEPGRLLTEVRRVLKPDGVVLVIGEHRVSHPAILYAKHFTKSMAAHVIPEAAQRWLLGRIIHSVPFFASIEDLLRPDSVMGDHYYLLRQYQGIFPAHGFLYQRITTPRCPFQAFVLLRQTGHAK